MTLKHRLSQHSILGLALAIVVVGMMTGCSSGQKEHLDGTFELQPHQTARLKVETAFGRILMINDGPGTLEIRSPAIGADITTSQVILPDRSDSIIFFRRCSIAFFNQTQGSLLRVHYRIVPQEDEVAIERMEPRAIRPDDPLPQTNR